MSTFTLLPFRAGICTFYSTTFLNDNKSKSISCSGLNMHFRPGVFLVQSELSPGLDLVLHLILELVHSWIQHKQFNRISHT